MELHHQYSRTNGGDGYALLLAAVAKNDVILNARLATSKMH
jgi:hypothetical protein